MALLWVLCLEHPLFCQSFSLFCTLINRNWILIFRHRSNYGIQPQITYIGTKLKFFCVIGERISWEGCFGSKLWQESYIYIYIFPLYCVYFWLELDVELTDIISSVYYQKKKKQGSNIVILIYLAGLQFLLHKLPLFNSSMDNSTTRGRQLHSRSQWYFSSLVNYSMSMLIHHSLSLNGRSL